MVTQKPCNSVGIKIGFGSTVRRFGNSPQHPQLDASGLFVKRPDACDPCLCSPQPWHEIFKLDKNRKIKKDIWRYKTELEDWSKNLGYRSRDILRSRRWQASLLGPAWTEIPDPVKYEPACKNVNFGRTARFKPPRNDIPGPGTYYSAVPFKASFGPHSTRPTFLREEPCRFKDPCPRWSLAPNRYRIVDKDSIEQKSKKVISRRGPYELFTGKRDGSTIKNHFSDSLRCSAATWPLALPGTLEKLKKSHYGKLNKTSRTKPYRGRNVLSDLTRMDPGLPGPTVYDPDPPRVFKQNKVGFNSYYDKPRCYKRSMFCPGVGRYEVKLPSCGSAGQGHRHVFLSKAGRSLGYALPETLNNF